MAAEKLALVGLTGLEKRSPSELSGGQQQRVAVARALVLEPQVLLFDEPLSNLDAKLRRRVREEIRELQLKLNLTVVYVTHDQEEALAVSDRIIVMSNARIAQIGTPRELYEEPASLFVADFIGDANVIDAELVSASGNDGLVRVGTTELTSAASRHLARQGEARDPSRCHAAERQCRGRRPARHREKSLLSRARARIHHRHTHRRVVHGRARPLAGAAEGQRGHDRFRQFRNRDAAAGVSQASS